MINKYKLNSIFWDTLFKIVFFICYPTKKIRERAYNHIPIQDDPKNVIYNSPRFTNKAK